jgi:hypothetical protein
MSQDASSRLQKLQQLQQQREAARQAALSAAAQKPPPPPTTTPPPPPTQTAQPPPTNTPPPPTATAVASAQPSASASASAHPKALAGATPASAGGDKLRTTRADRRHAEVEKLEQRWGDLLNDDRAKAELKLHAQRIAYLQRIRSLASSDAKIVESVDQLLTQEERRDADAMNALRSGAPGGAK